MQRLSPCNFSVNVGIVVVFLVIILPVVPVMAQSDPYRTQEAILADFFTLQNSYPAWLTSEVIGATVEGQDIYLFRLGNPTGVPVFIEAAIHGHEYITTEALYYCVEWVLTEQTDLLDTNYILFIPIINRDAYRLHRTNANGVDLNRNFPTYWQATGAGTIYYSGPAPLSEPETQAIHNAVAASQPRWFIDLHAGYAATRITPPSSHSLYEEVYAAIDATARHTFGVTPFPYDAYQFYEGMARYEGEAQGAWTWEIELSAITPSWDYFVDTVMPRLQAVLLETCRAGGSAPEPPPSNEVPIAQANGPYVGAEELAIAFTAAGSIDPDGHPLTYRWDFGDGSTVDTTSVTTTHTYTTGRAGETTIYPVRLVVNDGTVDSVPATTTATITGVNDAPVATTNGPYAGVVGTPIEFDATGSSDEEGISAYMWDLGDGTIASGTSPTHQYAAAGTYTVVLSVTDTDGAVDHAMTTAVITEVAPPPMAATAITLTREDSTRGRHGSVSRAIATVTITVDGAPLKGAVVYGHWSDSLEKTVVGTTNGDGTVTFRTDRIHDAEGFTFTIDAVEHDGVTYQLHGVTSASI